MKETKSEAERAKDQFYFTGKPCKYGHVAPRHTHDGCCSVCRKVLSSAQCRGALAIRREIKAMPKPSIDIYDLIEKISALEGVEAGSLIEHLLVEKSRQHGLIETRNVGA